MWLFSDVRSAVEGAPQGSEGGGGAEEEHQGAGHCARGGLRSRRDNFFWGEVKIVFVVSMYRVLFLTGPP